ncbi:MAG: rRNA maturation RNase YbeY [Verrucomicrobia bacterium]|nr:rRNA maturation RNase YbeY [Verrucomicrobiota bacterium]MCH8511346.1 rRNA maturation RNase YbeY [Kiritimatiellia bacterium]
MHIDITNFQTKFRIDEDALCDYAQWIMEKVGQLDPTFHWVELSIVLTDDAIRNLNYAWFSKDTITDVISFAYPDPYAAERLRGDFDEEDWENGDTGEVVINLVQAHEEGQLRDSPDRELALYLAHGCHHLTGAEDDTPERKRAMLALETAWVNEAQSLKLAGPFFI